MFIYTILVLFVVKQYVGCIDLTYISKTQNGKFKPSCAAEGNIRQYGIGWIYPIPDNASELPNITTKFVPEIRNDFNCNFSTSNLCWKAWSMKNWQINDVNDDFITDTRWESLPILYTSSQNSKELEEKLQVPNVFKISISIRATDTVELIVSEGSNPYTHSSYYFNVTKRTIEFTKFDALPKNANEKFDHPVTNDYLAYSNIISMDEWRNFELSFDGNGTIEFIDLYYNRTVIGYGDKNALKPKYLLLRSNMPTLWKIHKNEFLYTESAQVSRFGPTLFIRDRNLCISLYVSMCDKCSMNFFRMDGKYRKTLKFVPSEKQNNWTEIKIKEENFMDEKLTIFLETIIQNNSENETGFWAIDEVRVCHENEIKITQLNLHNIEAKDEEGISCQIVKTAKWKSKKLVFNDVTDYPPVNVSYTSDTIELLLNQEVSPTKPKNLFFITYRGNDICESQPYNIRRIKSNGFLTTEHNKLTIEHLVPFTLYDITISSLIYDTPQLQQIKTTSTEIPTAEELPNQVKIQVTDTSAYISWEQIDCTKVYGNITHSLEVKSLSTNFSKEIKGSNDHTHLIEGLEPFTRYTVTISTARSLNLIEKNLKTLRMSLNFATKPGVARAVANLEVYSTDENMVSFRYDLPEHARGKVVELQVMKCTPLYFGKCKTKLQPVAHCKLWPSKYCGHVTELISNIKYTFKISIKNNLTHAFGNESVIEAFTMKQVPAAPTYLNYEVVDCNENYCSLNITWVHPYLPNASITFFDITLNDTDTSNNATNIHKVYDVQNYTFYLPRYLYQIKNVPYNKQYKLYLYSSNSKYKSDIVSVNVRTPDIGQHIKVHPELLQKTDKTINFKLPKLDKRLDSYNLVIIVQDFDRNISVDESVKKDNNVYSKLCHNFGNTWISHNITVTEHQEDEIVIIGNDVIISNEISDKHLTNKPLKPKTQYCVTFLVTNNYKNTNSDSVYYKKLVTSEALSNEVEEPSQFNYLWLLILLLLLIPILGFIIYRCSRKSRPKRKSQVTTEHNYESMPFDDREDNNDSLLQK